MLCVVYLVRVCTVVQQSIDPHLHAMPAPSQRSDDALLRREARESAEQRERERQCTELRRECILKAQESDRQREQYRTLAQKQFEARQSELRQNVQRERAENLNARRQALNDVERIQQMRDMQADKERRKKIEAAYEANGMFAEQQQQFEDERQRKIQRQRKQALNFERKIQMAKEKAAKEEAEDKAAAAEESAKIWAMRSGIRAKQRRSKELAEAGNRFIREQMVANAKLLATQERERAKERSRSAEEKKQELNRYLELDHRVPRWHALGWHDKKANIEWRWPFSLDWSWLNRGERVLHDERFVGLTLPDDFVPPSARIMSRRRAEQARQQVEAATRSKSSSYLSAGRRTVVRV